MGVEPASAPSRRDQRRQIPRGTHQWLGEAEVHLDRPGNVIGRCAMCRRGERSPTRTISFALHRHVEERRCRDAEESALIDRLGRTEPAHLGRSVGGECQQRDVRMVRLHHRRMQLDRRGSARREHDGRLARGDTEAQGEKGRRPLVVVAMHLDRSVAGQRQRHRGRPRTGADDRVAHPEAHPFVDERRAEGRRGRATHVTCTTNLIPS